MLARG